MFNKILNTTHDVKIPYQLEGTIDFPASYQIMFTTLRKFLPKTPFAAEPLPAEKAYEIWSASYDHQPGNLMLHLDEIIFNHLTSHIDLQNKTIADIGCGTGRHWQNIYSKNPAIVMGFDVSAGMLDQLKNKFPDAITQKTSDNLLAMLPDAAVDCIFSTLTVAHIPNIEEAIGAWSRILKMGGDLVVTDFHPEMLDKGGKRSFHHEGRSHSVENYVHSLKKLKVIFIKHGFTLIEEVERKVDETIRSHYKMQNALHVYERFKGIRVIYGLHLKKQFAAQ
jgi:ubiquinone/menaquinone biosynthesis C-methylase UbiE